MILIPLLIVVEPVLSTVKTVFAVLPLLDVEDAIDKSVVMVEM